MDIRKFARTYDLDLIVASTENVILGTLVWDSIFRQPKLDAKGMPDTIFIGLQKGGAIDEDERHNLENLARAEPLVAAQMIDAKATISFEGVLDLQYPKLGKASAGSKVSQAKRFEFGNLQARTMSADMRLRLDGYLDMAKSKDWTQYFGHLRRLYVITELYYGTLTMVVDASVEASVDAELQALDVTGTAKQTFGSNTTYTIGKAAIPFAMRAERLRSFEG